MYHVTEGGIEKPPFGLIDTCPFSNILDTVPPPLQPIGNGERALNLPLHTLEISLGQDWRVCALDGFDFRWMYTQRPAALPSDCHLLDTNLHIFTFIGRLRSCHNVRRLDPR